jgi:hypothetical protein
VRNEKRKQLDQTSQLKPVAKCHGKTWSKQEIELMIELEELFKGNPRIAKEMTPYFPEKTTKQIRDKRREASYKALTLSYQKDTKTTDSPTYEVANENMEGTNVPVTTNTPRNIDCGHPQERNSIHTHTITETPKGRTEQVTNKLTDQEVTLIKEIIKETLKETPQNEAISEYQDWFASTTSIMREIEKGVFPTQQEIDEIYKTLVTQIKGSPKEEEDTQNKTRRTKRKGGRRKHKRFAYGQTQELYKKDPSTLAKYIREGTPWLEAGRPNINAQEIEEFYTGLWSTRPEVSIPFQYDPPHTNEGIEEETLRAITGTEIGCRMNRMKNNSAPGPDGINKRNIENTATQEALRTLFNILLICRIQPTDWKTNRTTLILKQGKNPNNVENYRPITIGSIISRLYWGIIDFRLRKRTTFSPRQKGFVPESGCFYNMHALNEILSTAKRRKGIVLIQIDICKAFDTIPHEAVDPALQRLGVPAIIRSAITNSYGDLRTSINNQGSSIGINLQRGVKQGDPLSPYIFNAILNPLLEQLEELKGYTINDTQTISTLAFADDIILLADNQEKAQQLLHHTEEYLRSLGMLIAPSKCTALRITTTKDSWYLTNPQLHLNGRQSIPSATAADELRYLGGHIAPWSGLQHKHLVGKLHLVLRRLRGAFLKPYQKLNLLTTYIFPHFLHATSLSNPPITTIRNMDSLIRTHVKDFLNIPASTPNGLLYCCKRDGGLGIPKLETLATTTTLKQGLKMLDTNDPALQAIMQASNFDNRLERMARLMRIQWPIIDLETIDKYKKRQKALELKQWSQLPSKGRGVDAFADDRFGNCWLYNPTLLKPSRFITALRMRGGTTSDRVTLNKAIPQATQKCRKCKDCVETLAHILGQCTHTKKRRIGRHNEIRDFLAKKLANKDEEIQVIEEASIETPAGTLKPDLVVVHQGRVQVIDVTVRHEDAGYLEEGHRSKMEKYTPLLPLLAEKLNKEPGKVLPIVIGTRGAIPKKTLSALADLNITDKGSYKTIALLALRNSIEIYHNFMDYDKPRDPT